jgi:hypothetical protein
MIYLFPTSLNSSFKGVRRGELAEGIQEEAWGSAEGDKVLIDFLISFLDISLSGL